MREGNVFQSVHTCRGTSIWPIGGIPIQPMGDTPIFPDRGYPHPSQQGDTPSFPIGIVPPSSPNGEGVSNLAEGGVPGYSLPHQDWMGVPACWDWMGYPLYQTGWGYPSPTHQETGAAERALATGRAVCLLHLRRRTFLYCIIFTHLVGNLQYITCIKAFFI